MPPPRPHLHPTWCLPIDLPRATAANDAAPRGRIPCAPLYAPGAARARRCAALARLVLTEAERCGHQLPATAAAVDALEAGAADAPWRAAGAAGVVTDAPLAEFVARFVARLVVEAFEPFVPGETLQRSTAAVLGQLGVGVDEARERSERAWNVDAS